MWVLKEGEVKTATKDLKPNTTGLTNPQPGAPPPPPPPPPSPPPGPRRDMTNTVSLTGPGAQAEQVSLSTR